jgi:aldehyde:ferredoxin oxidoreductase
VNELDRMLPEYYDLRGWNEAGEPTEDTLGRLGLS